MDMMPELYSVICDTFTTMNRTFDVPFEYITPDTKLRDLDIDDFTFGVIVMNIESRMKVTLPVDENYDVQTVGDVITMIKSSKYLYI